MAGVGTDPFGRMAVQLQHLEATGAGGTANRVRRAALLGVAGALQAVDAWAAQMQLGAEGFDNTTAARAYGEVQEHLDDAARAIEQACAVLQRLDDAWPGGRG